MKGGLGLVHGTLFIELWNKLVFTDFSMSIGSWEPCWNPVFLSGFEGSIFSPHQLLTDVWLSGGRQSFCQYQSKGDWNLPPSPTPLTGCSFVRKGRCNSFKLFWTSLVICSLNFWSPLGSVLESYSFLEKFIFISKVLHRVIIKDYSFFFIFCLFF